MYFHAPEPYIEQIFEICGICAKCNPRIRIHFKGTTVGNFKNCETIRSGDNDLAHLYLTTELQRPGSGILENRNLAIERYNLSGRFGRKEGQVLSRTNTRHGC